MDRPARRVLVVGGGTAGSVLTLALRRAGVEVVLAERQQEWRAIGHGITIQGNALRAFDAVGVAADVVAVGAPFDRLRLRTADGALLQELVPPPLGGPAWPATMGSMRYRLQEVLSRHVHASGAEVRLGTGIREVIEHDDDVEVVLTDGSAGRYDLVVGADGIHSTVRELIGVPDRPQPVGMAIWRMAGPRPAEVDCSEVYYGGPRPKAGYSPISADSMYAYLMDDDVRLAAYGDRPAAAVMAERAAGYGGPWPRIRAALAEGCPVDYRSLESLLVDGPWHRGHVLLIGDAAHACPPQLAQGAAMAAEDAVVLGRLAGEGAPVGTVLDRFTARRADRVAMVVRNSVQLAHWEIAPHTPGADPGGLMRASLDALAEPF
ncbi:FAD-dependent monooxygenase [Blastococcus sp. SYSU D00820]